MNKMRNYNTYLLDMRKSLQEKMFFLNEINVDDYDIIIDFGSGEGIVLEEIAKVLTNKTTILYGVDHDNKMQEITSRRLAGYGLTTNIVGNISEIKVDKEKNILVIFSSVLHEVEDYWTTIRFWLREIKPTVVIRDMYLDECDDYYPIYITDIIKYSYMFPKNFYDFVKCYWQKEYDDFDSYITEKDLYHYLLKYSYSDNWELELKENYASVKWKDIEYLWTTIYDRKYTLEYKKKKVYDDFGIELTKPTHRQMIVKVE